MNVTRQLLVFGLCEPVRRVLSYVLLPALGALACACRFAPYNFIVSVSKKNASHQIIAIFVPSPF